MTGRATTVRAIVRHGPGGAAARDDLMAVEDPLEIFIDDSPYAITMRMPGQDRDLVLGYCLTEGLIRDASDVADISHCTAGLGEKRIFVRLRRRDACRESRLRRSREHLSQSSCGLCGKESLAEVHTDVPPVSGAHPVGAGHLWRLKAAVESMQEVFRRTGSTHFAALCDLEGEIISFAEDIGRHNALDKAIGSVLRQGLRERAHTALVSSRLSYEMVLKAGMLGVEVLAGLSAATSLAAELAEGLNMTLVGHLRPERMNVYSHAERILEPGEPGADVDASLFLPLRS
ncbi:Protein fdhD [Desulfovibrio sp. X2]|uniref:formate dehydrogenase accessory sulfurtransferase FdhD n=1 Tax=Desulfovibrio sp. X2 TaxID=941449 RepID=UPI000358CD1C|nr:formate dehydrogenase accessory sulfurtransferase FdhD [Desulfovibrio sp. X2]EPR44391.1 Protein fdhD [Desulfovibrio sp. X2]